MLHCGFARHAIANIPSGLITYISDKSPVYDITETARKAVGRQLRRSLLQEHRNVLKFCFQTNNSTRKRIICTKNIKHV